MKIFCATWLQEDSQKQSLDLMDKRERLLSFYFIKTQTKTNIKEYCNESEPE